MEFLMKFSCTKILNVFHKKQQKTAGLSRGRSCSNAAFLATTLPAYILFWVIYRASDACGFTSLSPNLLLAYCSVVLDSDLERNKELKAIQANQHFPTAYLPTT
jgi:hypothetical protein